jgi:hypothetical protein
MSSAASVGIGGKASAGDNGAFAILWKNGDHMDFTVGVVGQNGIESNVLYCCDENGKLVKANQ